MTRYRLGATVDISGVASVLSALAAAGERGQLDPEITLSLMPVLQQPDPEGRVFTFNPPPDDPAPRQKVKRAPRKTNGPWPPAESIYGVVLKSLQDEAKTPQALREVLTKAGFSAGSVNSSLGRLEKANKVRRSGDGTWAAA